ncbi:MAG: hypothetical protein J2P18_13560 [Nocardia sp.]|nr:hypothetical protein [Nocardia sp.]
MAEEIDEIGGETAAMMKQMLQLATLVALRSRERGQREAEARVKDTRERVKDTRERMLREAREAKAKDPRNRELARMLERPALERGVSLERRARERTVERTRSHAREIGRYDSPERRQALAAHLSHAGVAPDLAAVRMLMDVSQAQPPEAAIATRPPEPPKTVRAREIDTRTRERLRERTRERER